MSIFGKGFRGGFFSGPITGVFDDGPSLIEKVDMLFKDVETEGKKQGYKKAASEYEKAFRIIEAEYKETKELIESQKNSYSKQSDILIEKLSKLERQRSELEKQVELKSTEVSKKYDIPIEDVRKSVASGALIMGTPMFDILGLIYRHKEKKLKEAEQRGYIEAKDLYEKKICDLKNKLSNLKKKGHDEIRELLDMISELFDAITEERMKIADLKILL